jgi:hypothetical protein
VQKELPGGSPELATLALGHAESQAGSKEATPETNEADSGLLTGARLFLVFLALMLAVFVSAKRGRRRPARIQGVPLNLS